MRRLICSGNHMTDERMPAAEYRLRYVNPLAGTTDPRIEARQPSEADIQRACVELWNLIGRRDATLFHVPNQRAEKVTAAMLKGQGVLAGVADLVVFGGAQQRHGSYRATVHFIELKTPSRRNNLSAAQMAFRDRCELACAPYRVVTSVDEFRACLEEWNLCR